MPKTTKKTDADKYSKTIAKVLRILGREGLNEEGRALLVGGAAPIRRDDRPQVTE